MKCNKPELFKYGSQNKMIFMNKGETIILKELEKILFLICDFLSVFYTV